MLRDVKSAKLEGKGVDIGAKGKEGYTTLGTAEQKGHKKIAELIRGAGAKRMLMYQTKEYSEMLKIVNPDLRALSFRAF